MRNSAKWAILAGGLVVLIFSVGFFHAEPAPMACRPAGQIPIDESRDKEIPEAGFCVLKADPAAPPAPKGLLALTSAPGYRRAATMALRVDDCTKA
jgi:hypothetical protein